MSLHAIATQPEDSFRKYIIVSVLLHASLVLVVTVKNLLLPSDMILVPESIRVDVVALPDKMPENPAPVSPVSEPAAAPEKVSPPEKVKLPSPTEKKTQETKPKSIKESQKKAIDSLKAKSAIERIREQLQSEQKKTTAENAKPQLPGTPTQYKGNVISSGNSFTGMSRLRVNEYLEDITGRIRQNWELPQWLSDASLKASVLVTIDSRGVVERSEIQTSSGNSVFDASCVAAVQSSAPFAPPPDEVKDKMILIRFPFE